MKLDELLNLSKLQQADWFNQASAEEREAINTELTERLRSQKTEIVDVGAGRFALLNQDTRPSVFAKFGITQDTLSQLEAIRMIKTNHREE